MKKFLTIIFSISILLLSCNTVNASPRKEVIKGPISGEVLKVIDGDTLAVNIHVWLGQRVETSLRIDGIDTPEIRGKCDIEKKKAKAAKQEIIKLLDNNKIELYNIRLGKYAGRILAKAKTTDGIDIASHMIKKGLARPYKGKKRLSWCEN